MWLDTYLKSIAGIGRKYIIATTNIVDGTSVSIRENDLPPTDGTDNLGGLTGTERTRLIGITGAKAGIT